MIKRILLLLLIITSLSAFVAAPNIYAQDNEDEEALENDLQLKLPNETDNPTFTLVFVDPSDNGVFLSIDGADKKEISSPFSLPSLGIGKHVLVFTYTDNEDAESSYETSIIVVPRPPEINPPEVQDNKLLFSGKGAPSSQLRLFLSGGANNNREHTEVKETGEWEYIVDGEFEEGIYTATAYVTKNGYGSELAEPVTFNIGTTTEGGEIDSVEEAGELDFALEYIMKSDFYNEYRDNTDLLLYTGIILLVGLILGILVHRFLFVRGEKKMEKSFKQMLSGDKKDKDKKKGKDKKEDNKDKKQKDEGATIVPLENDDVDEPVESEAPKEKKEGEDEWIDTEVKEEDEIPVFNKESEDDAEQEEKEDKEDSESESEESPEADEEKEESDEETEEAPSDEEEKVEDDQKAETSTEEVSEDESDEEVKEEDPDEKDVPVEEEDKDGGDMAQKVAKTAAGAAVAKEAVEEDEKKDRKGIFSFLSRGDDKKKDEKKKEDDKDKDKKDGKEEVEEKKEDEKEPEMELEEWVEERKRRKKEEGKDAEESDEVAEEDKIPPQEEVDESDEKEESEESVEQQEEEVSEEEKTDEEVPQEDKAEVVEQEAEEEVVEEAEVEEVEEEKEETPEHDEIVEEEIEEESRPEEETSPGQMSREEFLEKFKQHDPDPEEEIKTGDMKEKLATAGSESSEEIKEAKSDSEVKEEKKPENKEKESEEKEEAETEDKKSTDSVSIDPSLEKKITDAGKTVEETREMSLKQLMELEGIGSVTAEKIYVELHGKKALKDVKKKPKKKKSSKPRKAIKKRNIKISLTSKD